MIKKENKWLTPRFDVQNKQVSCLEITSEQASVACLTGFLPLIRLAGKHDKTVCISLPATNKRLLSAEFLAEVTRLAKQPDYKAGTLQLTLYDIAYKPPFIQTLNTLRELNVDIAVANVKTKCEDIETLAAQSISTILLHKDLSANLHVSALAQNAVKGFSNLALALNKHVVLTGVDSAAKYNLAKQLGVRFMQGRFFSSPLSFTEAEDLLTQSLPASSFIP